MPFPYKIAAFDLDGTLAVSKGNVSQSIASLLHDLSKIGKVVIISGGSIKQFEKQVLPFIQPNANIILLPAEGSERFEYDEKGAKWNMTDKKIFSGEIKKEVVKVLKDIISSGLYDIPAGHDGEYIEDRDTEIAFSALGQQAPLEEKEKWDPDREKRRKIKEELETKIKNISATISGTTSIDILPKGFNKGVGLGLLLKKLGIKKEETIFVGDAIVPGGNDYSLLEAGFVTVKVGSPEETERTIRRWVSPPVAFFCSEYALENNPEMYAGGLGVLAGDYLMEIRDQNFSFVAIGLKYGDKVPAGFSLLDFTLEIPNVGNARVWHSPLSETADIFLLDAGEITSKLYDPEISTRIKQQMVLGIGGLRLLKELGIFPKVYHLNEGHTAFTAVAIIVERPEDVNRIVATKHTILSAAGLKINFSDLEKLIGQYSGKSFLEICEKGKSKGVSSENIFSTTKFLLSCAVKKNAVSSIHAVFEKKKHPESTLLSITNGVYRKRWQAKEFYSRPVMVSDEELRDLKRGLKVKLGLTADICTLVWARRFAGYKRPGLLFSDLERLASLISNPNTPLQIIISGKPHEKDEADKDIRDSIIDFSKKNPRIVYLPDYSITTAMKLVQGADIWLNTPELGMEACGTSGMKSGLNGALQCSVLDGWVGEVSLEGRGWSLPSDKDTLETAEILYDLLEQEILPEFYAGDNKWAAKMRSTIELIEKEYTTARMLHDYQERLYNL